MSETVFTKVDYTLSSLMDAIELGTISLPDIQRPFVWTNAKVRDLFDSMYQGFPVGYLLFWENASADDARVIGTDKKQKVPSLLIVDGQQRLTALYDLSPTNWSECITGTPYQTIGRTCRIRISLNAAEN
jgi:hypothetical protein